MLINKTLERKKLDTSGLVTATVLNTEISELENKYQMLVV